MESTRVTGVVHRRAAVLAVIGLAPAVHAQVVRGVVTERVSGARIPGVVVTVTSVGNSSRAGEARHALTNARGEYAVTLPRAGTYSLSAKRIGVARYEAPALELRAGETRRLDISLARFDYKLPTVRVAANNLCIPRQDQFRTIVALWDEVRTALRAAEISQDGQLMAGWLALYNRSRVALTHFDSGTALKDLGVWLRWPDPEHKSPKDPITPGLEEPMLGLQSRTDQAGGVTFAPRTRYAAPRR